MTLSKGVNTCFIIRLPSDWFKSRHNTANNFFNDLAFIIDSIHSFKGSLLSLCRVLRAI